MTIRAWTMMFVLALAAGGLNAATIDWSGAGDGVTFTQGANWTGGVAPGNNDEALFDGTPAVSAVTVAATTVNRITVDSVANLNITFTLTGDVVMQGDGTYALYIGAGDALTVNASGGVRTFEVQDDVRLNGAGASLTFGASTRFSMAWTGLYVFIGNGSSLVSNGILLAAFSPIIEADNTGGTTVITLNDIEIFASVALEWALTGSGEVDVTVNGDIRAMGAAAYFGIYNQLSSGEYYNVTMNGDFDAGTFADFEFETDQAAWTFPGVTSFLSTTGGFKTSWWGEFLIPSGGSVTIPDNSGTTANDFWGFYVLEVDGTFDAGNNPIGFYAPFDGTPGTTLRVDSAATFTQDGDVNFAALYDTDIEGEVTFDGDVVVSNSNNQVVKLGSTVNFNGTLTINNNAGFGADEDGATATAVGATINYNGNVRVDTTDGLILGEGVHTFAGDIDLGFSSSAGGVVAWPDLTTNDFACQIHLTGTTVAVSFWSGSGSAFAVNSVQAGTRVTQVGTMILGWMDVSAATGAGSAWDGAASGDVILGGAVEAGLGREILTGALDVEFADVTVVELNNPSSANATVDFTFRSTGAGEFFVDSLTIAGDTGNDFGTAENNGGDISIMDCTFNVNTATGIVLTDGANGELGAQLDVENSTVLTDVLSLGGTGTDNNEGSVFELNNSTLTMGASGNFNALDFTETVIIDSTIEATTGADYAIFIAQQSESLAIVNSTITGDPAFNISIVLGAGEVLLVDNVFENYDATGVYLDTTSVILALNGNTFQGGVSGGSHITLNGLGNATKLNCDQNLFDNSTGAGGDALITITAATTNRLNFRCLTGDDFGLGAVAISAVQAEALDDDGTTATEVTWEEVPNELAVAPAASQPISLISDTASNQTVALFTLAASGATSTVTNMSFSFDAESTVAGALDDTDIATATLYADVNSNGQFDTGEEFGATTLNENVVGGDVTFVVPSETIAAATTATWGIAITFNAGADDHYGSISVYCLPVVGLTISNAATTIVSGLPLIFLDVPVTGTVADVVIITQPSDEQEDTAITPAVVVELRDVGGNVVLGRAFNVTASITSGGTAGAVLGGTLTVASSVTSGRSTFSTLSIDRAGLAYILRFTSNAITQDSAAFDITAAPPSGGGGGDDGGGCAAGTSVSGWAALVALFATVSLGAVVRLRRE